MKNNGIANELLNNMLLGDRQKCSEICQSYLSMNNSVEKLYEEVIKSALYEVGVLWEQNKISVTKEHIATAIAEGILNEIYPQIITRKKNGKRVLLSTIENEQHQVGIKMVADVFEKNNWSTRFIGSGVPTMDLLDYVHDYKPNIMALSLSIHFNYPHFLNLIETLNSTYPNILILVGGQAFNHIKQDFHQTKNYQIIYNLNDLTAFIKTYKYE